MNCVPFVRFRAMKGTNAASENHFWSGRVTRGSAVNIRRASSLLTPGDDNDNGQTRTSSWKSWGFHVGRRSKIRRVGASVAAQSASGMRYPSTAPGSITGRPHGERKLQLYSSIAYSYCKVGSKVSVLFGIMSTPPFERGGGSNFRLVTKL